MAPSWMTTKNRSINACPPLYCDGSIGQNESNRIMWPVLLTGSHSVMPSMMPSRTVLSNSKIAMVFPTFSKESLAARRPPPHIQKLSIPHFPSWRKGTAAAFKRPS